jgi:SNARE protein
MATDLPMGPQLEQIHGEIRDNFRALANGFQRLDKIKDSNRQSKQLEELTGKMRECKRLIKEFDRELKDEEAKNTSEVNKQLNDEKQSMVSIWNLLYFSLCLVNIHMHNGDMSISVRSVVHDVK